MMACCCGIANAAWVPSDVLYRLVDEPATFSQTLPKTVVTPQGTVVQTWTRRQNDSYYLRMQIYDPEGNALFEDGGKLVSDNLTMSWISDYDLKVADNGDILIGYNDCRAKSSVKYLDAYFYRFDQQGNAVWSAEGIEFPTKNIVDGYTWERDYSPQFLLNNGIMYWGILHSDGNSSSEGTCYELMRVNDDGTFEWDEPVCISIGRQFAVGCHLAATADGDVIVFYGDSNSALYAKRIDTNGNEVWDEDVLLDAGPLSSNVYTPMTELHIASDPQGGVSMVYYRSRTKTAVLNYIDANGVPMDTTLTIKRDVPSSGSASSLIAIGADEDLLLAFDSWTYDSQAHALVNLFQNHEYAWPSWPFDDQDGISLEAGDFYIVPIGVCRMSDGWAVFYANMVTNAYRTIKVVRIDDDGQVLLDKMVCGDAEAHITEYSVATYGNLAFLFTINPESYSSDGGMRLYCIDLNQHLPGDVDHNGVVEMTDLTLLIDRLLSTGTVAGCCDTCADANQDGSIDMNDLTYIIDMLLG